MRGAVLPIKREWMATVKALLLYPLEDCSGCIRKLLALPYVYFFRMIISRPLVISDS